VSKSLIDIVGEKIADALAKREAKQAELDAIVADAQSEARDLNSDEAAKFAAAKAEIDAVDAELDELQARHADLKDAEERRARAAEVRKPAYDQVGRVDAEPMTYRADNQHERSFFVDAFNAQFGYDRDAQERLSRHSREVAVERRDITTSTLNGLVPPLYLLDQAATLARAMRPFADVVPGYSLPDNGMTLYVTRVTTGTATAVQSAQNNAATETDMVTTDFTVPVVTILGQQDVSRQALERAAVTDQLIFNDLAADYATKLDSQWLSGSGSAGQSTGILNVSGIDTQTWTGTTVASFYSKLNGCLNAVASNRYAPATVIVMHPRRWHWLLSQADSSGRPLVVPSGPEQNPLAQGGTGYGVVGTLVGLPVVADANVTTTAGSSTNEDRIIVTRLSDHAGWENGTQLFRFEQAVNPPSTIRLAIAGYSAFTAGRYPAATSVLTGSGLATPSF